ncbi:hypothetical protein TWF970_001499 [Orbilia oligospora]|uniref:Uncharacterized protein n=1 Tax=Orbilia oligospora TaxID=2813651 RepID=A0A7C8VHB3_ORBOL|nr:hypothetical protein TWF970_001499 [Orbilia oligospora]
MAKVALPLHYPATDQKSTSFILTESIHIIEVEVEVDKAKVVSNSISSRTRNNSKPKSNVAQHPATTTNTNNANIIPPQISAIASTGLSHRLSISTQKNQKYHYYHLLTSTNNYALSTIQNHYTPSSPTLESLFMEATSCRSSQPGIETLVSVYNYIRGHKHPNGLFPPYQLGISSDDGVLSVYRSYKGEDLNFCPTSNSSTTLGGNGRGNMGKGKGIWWSDIMYEVWRRYSASSSSSSSTTTPSRCLRNTGDIMPKLRFVAIPEVNNEEVKTVTTYAFQKKMLDKECDMLVVDRDDKAFGGGGESWTLFDAFLGTASIKAINRMTMDHADELGYIAPIRIYVKYSRFEYPHIGEILLPNLLVEMRRVKV